MLALLVTHISGCPSSAAGRAQDRESLPGQTGVLPLCHATNRDLLRTVLANFVLFKIVLCLYQWNHFNGTVYLTTAIHNISKTWSSSFRHCAWCGTAFSLRSAAVNARQSVWQCRAWCQLGVHSAVADV